MAVASIVGYISHMMLKESVRSEAIDSPSSHGWTIPLNTRKTLDQVRNHPFATPRGKSHRRPHFTRSARSA